MKASLISLAFFTTSAYSQILIDPSTVTPEGAVHVAGAFQINDTDYEADDDFDIERTIIGATGSFGFTKEFDLIGQFGLALDNELQSTTSFDGESGTYLGFGGRGAAWEKGKMSVTGSGMLNIIKEEFEESIGGRTINIETALTEFSTAGVFIYAVKPNFHPYAGVELSLLSNGDIESTPGGSDSFEHESLMTLVTGCKYQMQGKYLHGGIRLIGENTLTFSGVFTF